MELLEGALLLLMILLLIYMLRRRPSLAEYVRWQRAQQKPKRETRWYW